MEALTMEQKIAELPNAEKVKAEVYIDELLDKVKAISADSDEEKTINRGFGSLKGQIWMSEDFDAPLKGFHDYMYRTSIEFVEKIEKLPVDKQQEIETLVDKMLN